MSYVLEDLLQFQDNNISTYPAILQNKLVEHNNSFKVINGGISGISTNNYMKVLNHIPNSVNISHVIIHNAVNDIVWSLLPSWIDNQNILEKPY